MVRSVLSVLRFSFSLSSFEVQVTFHNRHTEALSIKKYILYSTLLTGEISSFCIDV